MADARAARARGRGCRFGGDIGATEAGQPDFFQFPGALGTKNCKDGEISPNNFLYSEAG